MKNVLLRTHLFIKVIPGYLKSNLSLIPMGGFFLIVFNAIFKLWGRRVGGFCREGSFLKRPFFLNRRFTIDHQKIPLLDDAVYVWSSIDYGDLGKAVPNF